VAAAGFVALCSCVCVWCVWVVGVCGVGRWYRGYGLRVCGDGRGAHPCLQFLYKKGE